jgi:hypothetical protein
VCVCVCMNEEGEPQLPLFHPSCRLLSHLLSQVSHFDLLHFTVPTAANTVAAVIFRPDSFHISTTFLLSGARAS